MDLFKSNDRIISGVCGGFAERIGLNSFVVRITTLLIFIAVPYILPAYVMLALLLPDKPPQTGEEPPAPAYSGFSAVQSAKESIASVAVCTLLGVLISGLYFGIDVTFNTIISFGVLSLGLYMLFDNIFDRSSYRKTARLPVGLLIFIVGIVFLLGSFNIIVLSLTNILNSIKYLSPIIVVAIGVNFLLPQKKASIAIWLVVLLAVVVYTFYSNLGYF
ncbi:MAG: PspC domain-containing protein [Eubacteriaceae bacterium]|nr:PspC domain-containing protein [Eubacteriaceae bacterium]